MERALPRFMSESPKTRRNITPGCLMLMVGGLWLLVLGGWMVWRLYGQLNEIRTFADTTAKPISPVQPGGDQIAALRTRIQEFGATVGRKEKASLRLTVEDLNTLLSAEETVRGMRENAKVESIGDTVKLQISVALNGVPFSGERYYINGFAEIAPVTDKDKGLKIRTMNLTVPGKTVTEGFLDQYKEHGHLDTLLLDPVRQSKDPSIAETLKKLTSTRLEPGAVVLEYVPGS
jgi:hypothetical protein